jgi:hypothetical protein
MGSTGIHIERGQKMADVVLADLHPRLTVLKHQTRRTFGEWQYVLYAAIEDRVEDKVFGLVVLMHRNPSPHVYFNFTYKYVDETMGPAEDDCPKAILDLLTPTDSEYANDWRQRVRLNLDAPKPEVVHAGDVVTFATPLRFVGGMERDTFEFVRNTRFRIPGYYGEVRIPHWKTVPYTVTQKVAA